MKADLSRLLVDVTEEPFWSDVW